MPKRSTLRLTKRIVEKLKVEGKDAIFWDGGTWPASGCGSTPPDASSSSSSPGDRPA